VNIALANELAKLCENARINAWEVIELCNKHPRVSIHQPGPGVGGHCLAVDPWFIVERDPETARIIELARKTNDSMPQHVLRRIDEILSQIKEEKRVTILGITYKPNIDDIRESPIVHLIELMEEIGGYNIRVVDPYIHNYRYQMDMEQALIGSDLILLAVNHNEFKNLDFDNIRNLMRNHYILDTRNFFNEENVVAKGFCYNLLGRK
jgi:UDP-N-acetyl-D-mannosaminuronic acid dehydrogenase